MPIRVRNPGGADVCVCVCVWKRQRKGERASNVVVSLLCVSLVAIDDLTEEESSSESRECQSSYALCCY
jgi:hypothetical protein